MSYFGKYYNSVRYPLESEDGGLRRSQRGAIHAIAAHFTTKRERALVVMPTGSGKTAVLMLAAFVERANRVLVITPSRLVRNQIKEEFESLTTLRNIKSLEGDFSPPQVYEVEEKIFDSESWESLREFDVVVGTPNSVSPAIQGIPNPPEDLFDLLLIDEAHHSPAKTWNELLRHFPKAKVIMFTATPFRRDKREIKGRFIYTYSLRDAYEDGIFGEIEYIPVIAEDGKNDIAIAQEAERIFKEDRANGFQHYLMVRTDSKKRAKELKEIYASRTELNLQVINSDHSYAHIKNTIKKLRDGGLDGIICVDMLGEGFDFPQLKIAAIHAPHKSLEVTLQFIGRFARTNAANVGKAKFLAIPAEIEIEKAKLYAEGAIWKDIITEIGEARIERELSLREAFDTFETTEVESETEQDIPDFSLFSLKPFNHVKIYQIYDAADLTAEIELPETTRIIYRSYSHEFSATVLITEDKQKPRWSNLDSFARKQYDLFVFYFDEESKLLFINASRRDDSLYENFAHQLTSGKIRLLPLNKLNRVISEMENPEFFNIGMRNSVPSSNTESYRIITGPSAQKAISRTDGRGYHRGHVFGRGEQGDDFVTLGYSSSSKVWSIQYTFIPDLVAWCKTLARRITSSRAVPTQSGLDFLSVGTEIDEIPQNIITAQWHDHAYKTNPVVSYRDDDELSFIECELVDLDIKIIECTDENIRLGVYGEQLEWQVDYSIKADKLFTPLLTNTKELNIRKGYGYIPFINYLNSKPLRFFCADLSSIQGFEVFRFDNSLNPFDANIIETHSWDTHNVDIEIEFGTCAPGKTSIQDFLGNYLLSDDCNFDVVFYDHGTGEMADFITIKQQPELLLISLYHCKGAGGAKAGARVDDLYEVCGQAVKSVIWTHNEKRFFGRMKDREKKCREKFRKSGVTFAVPFIDLKHSEFLTDVAHRESKFLKGAAKFAEIEKIIKDIPVLYEVAIVQPGLKKSGLPVKLAEILSASDEHLIKARCEKLRVIGSD